MNISNRISILKNQLLVLRERPPVRLLTVSKAKSISQIEEVIHAGQFLFGENYVQEAIEKIPVLNQKYENLEWHYIGKIQKNKINFLTKYFDWVQTIDDEESARKLNHACEKLNKKMQVCLQVNISDESQKGGILINNVNMLADYIVKECPHLCLRGLMTIGLATNDEARLKSMFCQLKSCYDDLKERYVSVDTLSMGMTADMILAIECGSTMVRIGTAIFGSR